jgi:glucosyl-3-phosphoglycerate synthase
MDSSARVWFSERSSHWRDWPLRHLLENKQRSHTRISVVVPARNEERTVAGIITALARELVFDVPLIDELVVIDSDSEDGTAEVAAAAGAVVYRAREVVPGLGHERGKGEALWKSLFVTGGDLLIFIDADLTDWGAHFVTGLLGPLLSNDQVHLVKGFYDRAPAVCEDGLSSRGGRVTELVARPLLGAWWPELAGVVQPLAGEWAARRSLLESLTIPIGYGVELSTLLDTAARHGLQALAQVDLGCRGHRQQPDEDLALMAAELLAVAERRRPGGHHIRAEAELLQFTRVSGRMLPQSRAFPTQERPPVQEVRWGKVSRSGSAAW